MRRGREREETEREGEKIEVRRWSKGEKNQGVETKGEERGTVRRDREEG